MTAELTSSVAPVPADLPALSPYVVVIGAAKAIDFYGRAFAATEHFRLKDPSGKIGHAELEVGGCRLMLAEEHRDFGALSPATVGGTPVLIHLYVVDVDASVARAIAAGATVLRPLTDEFYGDRVAMLADPFGHKWFLATRKEEVTPTEMQRRMDAAYA
jgi:PhnB protein